jgi:hypothetical protein
VKLPKRMLAFLRLRVLNYIENHPPTRIIEGAEGEAYLERWELRGNNSKFDIYLHRFLKSDDARALHDHPAVSLSIILSGSYVEWFEGGQSATRAEGEAIVRKATTSHRIEIDESGSAPITIFIRGPKLRDWGFYCVSGWMHHKDFHTNGCDP